MFPRQKGLVLFAVVTIAIGTVPAFATEKEQTRCPGCLKEIPREPFNLLSLAKILPRDKDHRVWIPPSLIPYGMLNSKMEKKVLPKEPYRYTVLSKKFYIHTEGKRIYFCSSFCADKAKENAASIIKTLEAQGITLDTASNDEKTYDNKKAFIEKQKQENQTFEESLASKSNAEKKTLREQHIAQQQAELEEFLAAMINNDSGLTDSQKAEKIKKLNKHWAERKAKLAQKTALNSSKNADKTTTDDATTDGSNGTATTANITP